MNRSSRAQLSMTDKAVDRAPRAVLTLALSLTAVLLALSLLTSGSGARLPQEVLAFGLVLTFTICLAVTGIRSANIWFVAAPAVLAILTVSGALGPLGSAGHGVAILAGAGAAAATGWLSARPEGRLFSLLQVLCWTASLFCAASILGSVFLHAPGKEAAPPIAVFGAPEQATLLLGLLAVIGLGSAAHALRDVHGRKLARADLFETGLVRASGGLALLAASLACLFASRLTSGHLMSLGVLLVFLGWDISAFIPSKARNQTQGLRIGLIVIGMALAVAGVVLDFRADQTIAEGVLGASPDARIQRWSAYWEAFLKSPATGHGLGSVSTVANEAMTLTNLVALQAPGGVRNAPLQWLVETGVIGAGLLTALLLLGLVRLFLAYARRGAHASLPRFAFCVVLLMVLHGLAHSSLANPAEMWLAALVLGAALGSFDLGELRREKITTRTAPV
jgi:O-antigen ligase